MTDDNNNGPTTGLDRTFAPMLSELEDAEVRLTTQHAKAVAEVRRIDAELDRIAKVKRVMLGDPVKPKRARTTEGRTPAQREGDSVAGKARAEANRQRVMDHVRGLGDGAHFMASDIARELDMPAQGLGPILNGLERHGLVEYIGMTGDRQPRKRYRVAAEAEA